MKKNIRVIQYGLGTTGQEIATLMLEKEGIEIVGAIAKTRNIGKDLGEVLSADKPLGVTVSNDPQTVFSSVEADLVVHATISHLPDAWQQIVEPIEKGMDVITIAGRMVYPRAELAKEVDEKAKQCGVTVLGTGVNPGFALEVLPLFLSGICRKVTKVKVTRVVDMSKIRRSFLTKLGIGLTLDEFQKASTNGSLLDLSGFAGQESMTMIADTFGWNLDESKVVVEPVLAETQIKAANIELEPGMVRSYSVQRSGIKDGKECVRVEVECGVGFDFEAKNIIAIEGDPNVTESMTVEGAAGTAPLVVNSIPHVINAQPGLITLKDLPVTPCLLTDARDLIMR